jgi:hypothetical protein
MFEKASDDLLPTSRHTAVAGWFFGPKAENFDYLKEKIHELLKNEYEYRSELYSEDPVFITERMKRTGLYRRQLEKLDYELDSVGKWLREHSVPFFSPRYNAHMSMETSMPSLIGCMCFMTSDWYIILVYSLTDCHISYNWTVPESKQCSS